MGRIGRILNWELIWFICVISFSASLFAVWFVLIVIISIKSGPLPLCLRWQRPDRQGDSWAVWRPPGMEFSCDEPWTLHDAALLPLNHKVTSVCWWISEWDEVINDLIDPKTSFSVCYLLMRIIFFCIQERDQRRWNDSDFRCKEGKSSTAALQGHDGISGKIQTRVHRVIFSFLSHNQRWLSRDE